jgi:hypothetical protein
MAPAGAAVEYMYAAAVGIGIKQSEKTGEAVVRDDLTARKIPKP